MLVIIEHNEAENCYSSKEVDQHADLTLTLLKKLGKMTLYIRDKE